MEAVVTVDTGPYSVVLLDAVTTDHALIHSLHQLLHESVSLGLLILLA